MSEYDVVMRQWDGPAALLASLSLPAGHLLFLLPCKHPAAVPPPPQIIIGALTPDSGEVIKAKEDMRIAYLTQVRLGVGSPAVPGMGRPHEWYSGDLCPAAPCCHQYLCHLVCLTCAPALQEFDVDPRRTVREEFMSAFADQVTVSEGLTRWVGWAVAPVHCTGANAVLPCLFVAAAAGEAGAIPCCPRLATNSLPSLSACSLACRTRRGRRRSRRSWRAWGRTWTACRRQAQSSAGWQAAHRSHVAVQTARTPWHDHALLIAAAAHGCMVALSRASAAACAAALPAAPGTLLPPLLPQRLTNRSCPPLPMCSCWMSCRS